MKEKTKDIISCSLVVAIVGLMIWGVFFAEKEELVYHPLTEYSCDEIKNSVYGAKPLILKERSASTWHHNKESLIFYYDNECKVD